MPVAVVVGALLHGQFKQGQILCARLGVVGVMIELDPLGKADVLRRLAVVTQHLMYRMYPGKPVPRVYFLNPENYAFAAVGTEAPGIAVAHLLPAGVWLAFPIAEVLTAVIAAVLLLHTAGKGRLSQRDHAVSLDK